MSAEKKDSYLKDPTFQAAMVKIQNGEWEAGLKGIKEIQAKYPEAKAELEEIRQDIQLKSQVDLDEVEDQKQDRVKKIIQTGIRIGLVVILIAGAIWSFTLLDTWIFTKWNDLTQSFERDFRTIEQAIRFRDAQSYLEANYPEAALDILQEIASKGEDYPGLEELIAQAEEMKMVKSDYEAAIQLQDKGDTLSALEAFEDIYEIQPNYLDVEIRIQDIKGQFYLLDLLDEAEVAYEKEDWETAASQYETLRAIAPEYKSELVDTRLIRSYMNIADEILAGEAESPSALGQADVYFRKALMLRPRDEALLSEQTEVTESFKERLFQHYIEAAQETVLGQEDSLLALETAIEYYDNALLLKPNDPETILERNLAKSYLEAQIDFAGGSIYDVIAKLEFVYDVSPNYANGTALQILYESYMQRGEIRSATGEYGQALEDYQRAVELSINAENPILKLYLAKVQVAEIQGILSDYELACDNYREAADLIDLLLLLEDEDQNAAFLLKEAERYADMEWYRTAYRLYRRVMPATDIILDIAEIIIIKEGDYLANLANIYGTTVEEILELNALPNAGNIKLGQEIKIPGLKGLKEFDD